MHIYILKVLSFVQKLESLFALLLILVSGIFPTLHMYNIKSQEHKEAKNSYLWFYSVIKLYATLLSVFIRFHACMC